MKKLLQTVPEAATILKHRHRPGRPRLEDDQPLLLKTIVDIAMHGSAAHERRRTEEYKTIKTLKELSEQLRRVKIHINSH